MPKQKPGGLKRLKRRLLLDLEMQRRLRSAEKRSLPDFLVIGAMKCGSTSIYDSVKLHPQIIPAYKKAAHYFDLNYTRGEAWYRAHFPLGSEISDGEKKHGTVLSGESSPYYIFHPLAAARAAQLVPEARLIALLRNPTSRAYSHYQHMLRTGRETLSFEDALDQEPERLSGEEQKIIADPNYPMAAHRNFSYMGRGMYADQLQRWFNVFAREQFLILRSEDFFKNPAQACQDIYRFLGLVEWDPGFYDNSNPGKYPPINPDTRRRLEAFFRPHNQRLYEMLGIDFGWEKA
jgi:hypothetical protein